MTDFISLGSKITVNSDCSHEIKRRLLLERKAMTNLDRILKSRDIANKGPSSQSYVYFSSSRVWMWELDHKEGWALKNWCLWTVVLEKTLESPWTARRSNQSILKEVNIEYWLEGRMLKLQLSTWCERWLIGKDPDARKDWGQEEKGATEDEVVGWHHRLNGLEFEQTPRDSKGRGRLACRLQSRTWLSNWTTIALMGVG